MRKHLNETLHKVPLQHLLNHKSENEDGNPWFVELWREILLRNPDPNLFNISNFKIDSKVENVMNVAVLYSETFKNYSKKICPRKGNAGLYASCIHERFNGTNFFNNFILNARGRNDEISWEIFY